MGVSLEAKELPQEIQKDLKPKKDKLEPPDINLGAKFERKMLNGRKVWTMYSKDYIKLAIKNIESRVKLMGMTLPGKVTIPMSYEYVPELDMNWELNSQELTFYQEIIGILR